MNHSRYLAPTDEQEYSVLLQLTGNVRARLRRFMNRQEFIGLRPSEIINLLLDREEAFPSNIHSYASKRQRIRVIEGQQRPRTSSILIQQSRAGVDQAGDAYDMDYVEEEGEILDDDEEAIIVGESVYSDEIVNGGRNGPLGNQHFDYYSMHSNVPATFDNGSERDDLSDGDTGTLYFKDTFNRQRQWTSSLRRFWYGLVVKWQTSGLLHCQPCDMCMNVVVRGVGLRAGNAFDHACKHLGKPLFSCRVCRKMTVTTIEMRDHIRAVHQSDIRSTIDFVEAYSTQLEQMIEYCYEKPPAVARRGANSVTSTNENVAKMKRKKRSKESVYSEYRLLAATDPSWNSNVTARQFCYQLIAKWQRDNSLYCRECDQWLRVAAKNNWLRSETAMQHICGHVGKPLYKCRKCPQSMSTSRQIRQHLQTVHHSGIRGQYVDLTERLQSELKRIAALCFDWSESEDGPPMNDGRFVRPRLRVGLESNAERQEALSQCRRLIKTNVANGRMLCHVCGTAFVATTANGYPLTDTVYNHCLKHIDPAPYACNFCTKRTYNSANMRTHIWSKHKDQPLTEFVDYTSQLHDLIMATLEQCFGSTDITENPNIDQDDDAECEDIAEHNVTMPNVACFSQNDNPIINVATNQSNVALMDSSYDGEINQTTA